MTVEEILKDDGKLREAVEFLLCKKYLSEFVIIDGLSRHPDRLTFAEWVHDRLENG
jgi:hypothetical protein